MAYSEQEMLAFQRSLDERIFEFIREEPFLGYCGKIITKVIDLKTKTLCIGYDQTTKFVTLKVNPEFFFDLSSRLQRGCLSHEYLHFVLGHITNRLPPKEESHNFHLHNIAMDLAVNCIVGLDNLPTMCYYPGPKKPIVGNHAKTDWQYQFLKYIQTLPENESYEWYYSMLLKYHQENPMPQDGLESLNGMIMDDHSEFGGTGGQGKEDFDKKENENSQGTSNGPSSEEEQEDGSSHGEDEKESDKEIMDTLIEKTIQEAIANAESSNSWGTIPASMIQELKKKFSKEIPWQTLLKMFVARSRTNTYTSTVKRLSKKLPYLLPGNQRDVISRIVIFEDQSGSMGNEVLELVCSELDNLSKISEFDFYSFDTKIDKKSYRKFKMGEKVKTIRTRSGGTSYDDIANFLDGPEGRCYDCAIIITDGFAPSMRPTRKKVLWVLTQKNHPAKPLPKDVVCYLPKKEKKK